MNLEKTLSPKRAVPRYDTVWLDMDGVLADFVGGAMRHTGKTHLRHDDFCDYDIFPLLGTSADAFFRGIDEEFWAELPRCPDFDRIVDYAFACGRTVGIASMPPPHRKAEALAGKRRWLARHLPQVSQIRFLDDKHTLASPGALLMDDLPRNVAKFRAHGGDAHLVPRPWNKLVAA